MIVYLATPIDQVVTENGVRSFRQQVYDAAKEFEIAIYDPSKPFFGAKQDPTACYDINEMALERCDALLAGLPSGVPSIGVPMEIQRAHDARKPVAVVGGSLSMQLAGMGISLYDDPRSALICLLGDYHRRVAGGEALRYVGEQRNAPRFGYPGDAGLDLIVEKDTVIPYQGFADVPHGISVQLPEGTWGLITGRSSTIRKRGLLVVNGVIDNGYRGPLFAAVQNLNPDGKVVVCAGERIAQLILFPLVTPGIYIKHVNALDGSERGEKAFGSTGGFA